MNSRDSWRLPKSIHIFFIVDRTKQCNRQESRASTNRCSQLKSSNLKDSIGFLLCIPAVFALVVHRLRLRLTVVRVIIEICHIKLKLRANVTLSEPVRCELNMCVVYVFELTWGSWLFVLILGFRQYSSSVNGTTIPSFSASTFDCNACFLFDVSDTNQIIINIHTERGEHGGKKKRTREAHGQ